MDISAALEAVPATFQISTVAGGTREMMRLRSSSEGVRKKR
jgi:hypothetical protein